MSAHQSNYEKIMALRETSNSLDSQIRETFTLLTTTRRDLIATSSTNFPTNANPISYSELLGYARRISKYTLPPTFRETPPSSEQGGTTTNTPREPNSRTQTNGTNTPVVATNGESHSTTAMEVDSTSLATGAQAQSGTGQHDGVKTNLSVWEQYLNPSTDIPFSPWPTEEAIRKGALASIQVLVDQGIDPASFDPERSAELEAERKRIVEEEDAAREKERVDREEARRREMERRMSTSGPAPERRETQPKVFQLETFDDDDDDD